MALQVAKRTHQGSKFDPLPFHQTFERMAARRLKNSDAAIAVAAETCALGYFEVAKRKGMKCVLDCHGIPVPFLDESLLKAANEFGQFSHDKNAFCLFIEAEVYIGMAPNGNVIYRHYRVEGPHFGEHHEIAKKVVLGRDVTPDQLELHVRNAIRVDHVPLNVNVFMTVDGKAEVFSSALTACSLGMQEKLVDREDISDCTVSGGDEWSDRISRRNACCAYCLASTPADCLLCEHPACEKKWTRKLRVCNGCRSVFYCSPECQRKDWARGHITACKIFRWLSPKTKACDKPTKHEVVSTYCSWMETKALKRGVSLNLQNMQLDATEDPKSPLFGMDIQVD
jgi:hypothetical protein